MEEQQRMWRRIIGRQRGVIGVALTSPASAKWAVAAVAVVGATSGIHAWSDTGIRGASVALAITISGWLTWSGLATLLGNWAFGADYRPVSWWSLARAFGFAQLPGVVRLVGPIDPLGSAAVVAAFASQVGAMAVVLREAYDFNGFQAPLAILGVALAPWLAVQVGILFLLSPS
jgi:hypothetical protein